MGLLLITIKHKFVRFTGGKYQKIRTFTSVPIVILLTAKNATRKLSRKKDVGIAKKEYNQKRRIKRSVKRFSKRKILKKRK